LGLGLGLRLGLAHLAEEVVEGVVVQRIAKVAVAEPYVKVAHLSKYRVASVSIESPYAY
jgi:hypothetical protein